MAGARSGSARVPQPVPVPGPPEASVRSTGGLRRSATPRHCGWHAGLPTRGQSLALSAPLAFSSSPYGGLLLLGGYGLHTRLPSQRRASRPTATFTGIIGRHRRRAWRLDGTLAGGGGAVRPWTAPRVARLAPRYGPALDAQRLLGATRGSRYSLQRWCQMPCVNWRRTACLAKPIAPLD